MLIKIRFEFDRFFKFQNIVKVEFMSIQVRAGGGLYLGEALHNRMGFLLKVSATLKIAIFPYLRFQRFQIDMLESFLLKKIRRKYYFCRKISGVKDLFSLIILIDS